MKQPFHVLLGEKDREALQALADREGLTLAQAARCAIRREYERYAAASVPPPGKMMAT
jgi:hypothetical protein